jgi:hypothetical protein
MLKSEIRTENGLSTIYVDGKPVWPMTFCSRHNDDPVYHKHLQDAGIKMFWPFCDTDWQRPGAFEVLKAKCDLILANDPDALIMVRVSINPPAQWLKDNPGEMVTFENGAHHFFNPKNKSFPGYSAVRGEYNGIGDYSMASSKWIDDVCKALDAFIDRIDSSSFAHRVMGYFLNAGGTEEWYYGKTQDRSKHCMGFSDAFKRAFTRFLREKYAGDLAALRKAWRDDAVTFENPPIPSCKERYLSRSATEYEIERMQHKADFGSFLDPDKSQRIADFYEAWNAGTAYSLVAVSKFIKEKTEGKALVGAFYGCQGCVLYQDFGTSKTSMALASPYVDFLSAPTNYEDRIMGGGASFTNPIDSMHLHRKAWINEDDTGTCLQGRGRWARCVQSHNIYEDIEIMKRDFARDLCQDAYAWWFENSAVDKWWDHPEFFKVMKRMQDIARDYYLRGRSKNSQIACLYDEESIWYADNETCKDAFQFNSIYEFPRVGAPTDHYFVEDLLVDHFPADKYKVFVILNAAYIRDAKRRAIERKLKRGGNVIVWVYSAGFMDPGRSPQISMDYASELAGITLATRNVTHDLTWLLLTDRHPYTTGLSKNEMWGRYRRPLFNGLTRGWELGHVPILHPSLGRPLFYAKDKAAKVLGRFIPGKEAAFAVKDMGDWTSVFVGSKVIPGDILRNIARAHGVHVYNDLNDVTYANNDFLAVHTFQEGPRTLRLPKPARRVTELFDETLAAENVSEFTITAPFGATKLYRTEY